VPGEGGTITRSVRPDGPGGAADRGNRDGYQHLPRLTAGDVSIVNRQATISSDTGTLLTARVCGT